MTFDVYCGDLLKRDISISTSLTGADDPMLFKTLFDHVPVFQVPTGSQFSSATYPTCPIYAIRDDVARTGLTIHETFRNRAGSILCMVHGFPSLFAIPCTFQMVHKIPLRGIFANK